MYTNQQDTLWNIEARVADFSRMTRLPESDLIKRRAKRVATNRKHGARTFASVIVAMVAVIVTTPFFGW